MNVNGGAIGTFAGGLTSGFLAGQQNKRQNKMADLATQKDARDQAAESRAQVQWQNRQDALGEIADSMEKSGHTDFAKYLRSMGAPAPTTNPVDQAQYPLPIDPSLTPPTAQGMTISGEGA